MGRFDVETKGLDLLLRALASMNPNARPPVRLHGPDWRGGKQRTAQLVRELGLEDVITIGPALYGSQKWEALRDCRLFVFPARWDGQSVMVLEAAAAGAPLLVTSTTPIGRMMASQQAALAVDATAEAIASGIVRGLSSEAATLGVRASQVVRERFSWPAVAESYRRQVSALLGG
jgi:glycosyltransferase involved in cell wall biosynthesis